MHNAYAVALDSVAVLVRTNDTITRLPFRTKPQADKKILELIRQGYTFDRALWSQHRHHLAVLHIEAHNLCCALCDKLYNWNPEPERAARLTRVLTKARARLARRECLV